MPYTKPDQTPFSANLFDGEFVVLLDTGELVAVSAHNSVEPNSGNTVIEAGARVVAADGTTVLDPNGQPIRTLPYSMSMDMANVTAVGGMAEFQRKMLLTVLGEDAAWPNPPHVDVLEHASIRSNIAAAAHAGPVASTGTLL